jgi:hypothetical protein
MAQISVNQIMLDAINQGKLTYADADSIAKSSGFTGTPGNGAVEKFFNSDANASQKAIQQLSQRGLIPQQSLQSYMGMTATNPDLPSNSTAVPQTMQVQQGEIQQAPSPLQVQPISAPPPVIAPTVQAQQASLDDMLVSYQDSLNKISQNSGQYNAALVGNQTPQAVAAQGNVAELATVQGQLKKLYADTTDGEVPLWAKGAVRKAEDVLASRRLGASSIGAGAITEAIQQSALNIAAQDAATYFQMDLTNLGNAQQTILENVRLKQQSLLTDTAALNAAQQFNASSIKEVEMFQANLIASIQSQNASRVSAIRTFNTAEVNKINLQNAANQIQVAEFNTQQAMAVQQFNAQLKFNADSFNANMASTIDASNTVWRRQINTANTAAINAANQVNVQNAFNLSNYALNSLWQQSRDEANWLWQSSEKALDYQRNLGVVGAERDSRQYLQSNQNDFTSTQEMYATLGTLATKILGGL